MSHLPFIKPKPIPVAPTARRHTVHNPHSCVAARSTILDFPKSPIKVTFPWVKAKSSFLEERIEEYKMVYPLSGAPSTEDLIRWLYNRAINAEHNTRAYADEVKRLEQEAGINASRGP